MRKTRRKGGRGHAGRHTGTIPQGRGPQDRRKVRKARRGHGGGPAGAVSPAVCGLFESRPGGRRPLRHRHGGESGGVLKARRGAAARRAHHGAGAGGGRQRRPVSDMVQHPLRGGQPAGGAGILFRGPGAGHTDEAGDGEPHGAHPRSGGKNAAGGGVSPDGGPWQRPNRPVRGPGAGRGGAAGRDSAAGVSDPVQAAGALAGPAGHPPPRLHGRRGGGKAAAGVRRIVHPAAGPGAFAQPGRGEGQRGDGARRPWPLLVEPALCPHRGPATGGGGDLRRHDQDRPHEPAAAGRRGQRQDAGGGGGGVHRLQKRSRFMGAVLVRSPQISPAARRWAPSGCGWRCSPAA